MPSEKCRICGNKLNATPKERLFGNLAVLKREIKEIETKLRIIDRYVDNALSWESLIIDKEE